MQRGTLSHRNSCHRRRRLQPPDGRQRGRHACRAQGNRKELVDEKIAEHHGRIVKLTGDGMLVEFLSVVNAIACAAAIQRRMRERNADVPDDRRIEFRIGVNLGGLRTTTSTAKA